MGEREDEPGKDIQNVIREERSRGRRRVDTEAAEKEQRLFQDVLRLFREARDEKAVERAIASFGIKRGDPRFDAVISAWREMKRKSR
jgi:hypothetical protein